MAFSVTRTLIFSAICVALSDCCYLATVQEEPNCSQSLNSLPNFKTYGNKSYYFNAQKVNWYEANLKCKEINMDLVAIEDDAEFDMLRQFILDTLPSGVEENVWTSGTDLAKEGVWKWMTNGRRITSNRYHDGQPDNYNGAEHCLHFWYLKQIKLNDTVCTSPMYFICETKRMCLAKY